MFLKQRWTSTPPVRWQEPGSRPLSSHCLQAPRWQAHFSWWETHHIEKVANVLQGPIINPYRTWANYFKLPPVWRRQYKREVRWWVRSSILYDMGLDMKNSIWLKNNAEQPVMLCWSIQIWKSLFVRIMDVNSNFLMPLSTYGHVYRYTPIQRECFLDDITFCTGTSLWVLNTGTTEGWSSHEKVICLLPLLLKQDLFPCQSCCMNYKSLWMWP